MLGFKDFCEEIKSMVPEYLMQYSIDEVRIAKTMKNNGQEFTGMSIMVDDETIAPNIYLDGYYGEYVEGTPLDSIMSSIRDEYLKARSAIEDMYDGSPNIYDEKNMFIKLVNYDKNIDMLKDIPHERYLDMAVTVRTLVSINDMGISSATVDNNMLQKIGMTAEELIAKAKENTPKLFPPVMKKISEVLNISGMDFPEPELYVLTNNRGINGASCILYDNVLKEAAQKLGGSYKVLPSSIHEVLLLPDDVGMDVMDIQEMVKFVNETEVSEQEYLSDSVYGYDSKTNTLSMEADGREASSGLER